MAKETTIDVKGIRKNLSAGDIFLLNGKKQVVVDDFDVKKSAVTIDFRNIGKEGKLATKEQKTDITEPHEILPIKGKLITTVTATEAAVKRAMKQFIKAAENGGGSKEVGKTDKPSKVYVLLKKDKKVVSAKTLKETKTGVRCSMKVDGEIVEKNIKSDLVFESREDAKSALKNFKGGETSEKKSSKDSKPSKVYVLLKKDKKIVSGKALKRTKTGVKCSFNVDGENVERNVKSDLVFEDRAEAKSALKNFKGGETSEKKSSKDKADDRVGEKVFILIGKKVIPAKIVKLVGKKVKVAFKDEEGDRETKSLKSDLVFEDRAEAKASLKSSKKSSGKKGSSKASGKKAAPTKLSCGSCRNRNPKKNDCKWYSDVYEDSDICEDGHYKAK